MANEFRIEIASPEYEIGLTAQIWYGDFEQPFGSYHLAQISKENEKLMLKISQYKDLDVSWQFEYEEFISVLHRAKLRLLELST